MNPSPSHRDQVADEVLASERRLLLPEVRSSRPDLEALLHPDFREIGASGRVWSREDLVAELVAGEHPPAPEIESPRVEVVTDGVALLTYFVAGRHGPTWRSSLWTARAGGGWHVYFHQGTPAGEPVRPPGPATSAARRTTPRAG